MATGTAGTTARRTEAQCIHYMRADFNVTEADASGGTTKTVGVLPAGAIMIRNISGFMVLVAFDDSTVVDIGTSATGDLYATNLATTSTGMIPIDEAVTNKVYVDTTVVCNVAGNGNVTVGAGSCIIAYVLANDTNTWLGEQS